MSSLYGCKSSISDFKRKPLQSPGGQFRSYIQLGSLNVLLIITESVPSNISHVSDNVKTGSAYLARSKGYNLQNYVSDFLIFSCKKV